MKFESFDGLSLSYDVEGDGPAVLMSHGIVVDSFINFVRPGIVDALKTAGFQAITYDQRGHGMSERPHEPERYAGGAMARDAQGLLDHLGVRRCAYFGYSMGAMIGLELIPREPRIAAAILGGVGGNTLARRESGQRTPISDAMLAEDKTVVEGVGRMFRDFADLIRADRVAIAGAAQGLPGAFRPEEISVPTLVICGDADPLAGDPAQLASRISGATSRVVGGSHLNVVNNPNFHEAVVVFLEGCKETLAEA